MVNVEILAASVVVAATFYLIPTLGEIYSEQSGVLNLGIEGMVVAGAAGAYAVAYNTNNIWIGLLAGMLIGGLLALIHAILTITFNRNQIVTGIGLTILGTGLSGFLGKDVVGKSFKALEDVSIPILSDIPFFGSVLFDQNLLVYISVILTFMLWFMLYKTRLGILIRTVGENPHAALNQGVNVRLIRYLCVVFGGMLAGLGGAYLSLGWLGFWSEGMTQGRGWIVIALVIVAFWNPIGALFGSYVFGTFDQLQYSLQRESIPFIFPNGVPTAVLKMMPYLVTITFLAIWSIILSRQEVKSTLGAPSALAKPFEE